MNKTFKLFIFTISSLTAYYVVHQYLNNRVSHVVNIVTSQVSIQQRTFLYPDNDGPLPTWHWPKTKLMTTEKLMTTKQLMATIQLMTTKQSMTTINNRALPNCSAPKLDGPIKVELNPKVATKFPDSLLKTINKGGWWRPPNCKARKEVAILIPFRQRDVQLKMFLYHIHPFLQKQLLAYRIFVIEHLIGEDYNKGSSLNAGFLHARNYSDYDCFIFHDVDYLPEHDGNDYGCVASPRHYALCNDWQNYIPTGGAFLGGVFSCTRSMFERINGFSNLYFGWGAEDDDIGYRFNNMRFKLTRPTCEVGRYTTNRHEHTRSSTEMVGRMPLKRGAVSRQFKDGLNSIKYHLEEIKDEPLYTHMKFNIKKSDYKYPTCVRNKCTYD